MVHDDQNPEQLTSRLGQRLRRLYGAQQGDACLPRLKALIQRWQQPIEDSLRAEHRRRHGQSAGVEPGFTERDAVLIAYGDHLKRPGQQPLATLAGWSRAMLKGLVSVVHVLPFHPSTSYEGYAITDYHAVDPALGSARELASINEDFALMMDVVLNHCSAEHPWFSQFLADQEPGRRYFITVPDPAAPWLTGVFRARDLPLTYAHQTARGVQHVWATYSPDLVDLNWREPDLALEFLDVMLESVAAGARVLRLDAFGYVWKAEDTCCVDLPQGHEIIRLMQDTLAAAGGASTTILPSVTNVTQDQYYVYFGAGEAQREADLIYHLPLSGLLLHTLYNHDARALTRWVARLPDAPPGRAYLNLAASHDGVGLSWMEGLISPDEMDSLVQQAQQHGALLRTRKRTVHEPARPWELNCTYFSACAAEEGEPDSAQLDRLMATQGVVLALRGVPALYLSLFVAGTNDHEGVRRAAEDAVGQCQNRKINRGRFEIEPWEAEVADPNSPRARALRRLQGLLRARTSCAAFHPEGAQRVLDLGPAPLFAMLRTPPPDQPRERSPVLCLTNFAGAPLSLPAARVLEAAGAAPTGEVLRDLVGERCVPLDQPAAALTLAPYQTRWLTRCPPLARFRAYGLQDPRAPRLLARGDSKVVHLIRHGASAHQLKAAAAARSGRTCRCFEEPPPSPEQGYSCPYFDPSLVDSDLDWEGRKQAAAHAVDCDAEVVLSSVMTRSLHTATVAFWDTPTLAPTDKPIIALEQLRARMGAHMHSRRRAVSTLRQQFPGVDYSGLRHDGDVLWGPEGETRLSLDLRVSEALRLLFARPEKRVAVVTHFTVLIALFFAAADTRILGRNQCRSEDDPALLDCSDSHDPEGLSAFITPGQRRALILVPA